MASFCTAVNCMDGRVQTPVIAFLRRRFNADYVDTVTEPGPNGILAAGEDTASIESILRRVFISVEEHGSVGIAVVGHHDYAGNPAPKDEQIARVRKAKALLREYFRSPIVIGLWVDKAWQVHEI